VQADDLRENDGPAITAFAYQMASAWSEARLFEQAQIEIAARKAAEAQVRRLNEKLENRVIERTRQLEAANKELEAFAYSVSHDLRAPLRAIDGYSQILVEDYEGLLDAEGLRFCSVIRDEAKRMSTLIDDLLTFSRLSRSDMQLHTIDMRSFVCSIFSEITTPEDRARIDFRVGALETAAGDQNLLHQVWLNLLSNAVKFSSRQVMARIEVGSQVNQAETVYFIHDNGVGFDMKYAEKLFGVFQRLHSEREFPGTGVGLAIVQRIIHRHGGRVWADSQPGQGATFYFALPRRVIQS
jgi:light-regulated signal transduction histidine kinase (bacteriophytochrome)